MKKTLFLLASAALLAACGQQPANQTQAASGANEANDMPGMGNIAVPTEGKLAKGSGTVTAIDLAAGKITLDHGPLPEANWPAMTMAFNAEPTVLRELAVGDKVAFDVIVKGEAGEVTAVHKQ